MEPSAPPIPNIYPAIPPHPTQEKSPETIPPYQVPPYSAHPVYPPQQQFTYQQPPQQGYYPTMQPPVAAPRQSVDMGNPQNLGNPQNYGNPQQQNPHQTIIKTEVNLGPEMMQNLQNMGISQNKESERPQRPAPPVRPVFQRHSWKSGQIEYGISYTSMASECGSWFNYFVEICHGGLLKLSTYCAESKKFKLEETLTITKDWYVCIQRKKYVCLQPKGSEHLHVLKPRSEASCEKWLYALSDYATAGPVMSGYCDKFRHSKGNYHKYFLRLKTNGSLDWFDDHFEAESASYNSVGCIQVRGTTSKIEADNLQVVTTRVAKRDYKFKFRDASEASAWLQAFQFYSDKKQLKNSKFKNR